MTAYAADVCAYTVKAARRDVYEFECKSVLTTGGAISTTDADDPACAISKGSTGIYNFTFPIARKGRLYIGFKSAAGTVKTFWITAFDPTAGTASVTFGNGGGTATDPASGDEVWFFYRADSRAD